jgi:hypothetical protein
MYYPTHDNDSMSVMAEQSAPETLEQRIIDPLYTFCKSATQDKNAKHALTYDASECFSQGDKQKLNVLARKFL